MNDEGGQVLSKKAPRYREGMGGAQDASNGQQKAGVNDINGRGKLGKAPRNRVRHRVWEVKTGMVQKRTGGDGDPE